VKKILSTFLIIIILIVGSLAAYADYINYTVTARALNIRQQPNTNCAILGVVRMDTPLQGEESLGGWTPILWNEQQVYVCSKYITAQSEPTKNVPANYTQADLDLLARVICCEAGSSWLTDEHQLAVGSVVLNRVADSRFPNTISGVVYQKGQYACVPNGAINRTPSERALKNAKYLLENGVTIPTNVVWQAQFRQGNGVWKYVQGHYFCY
jgi:hypothetical protein